MWYLEVIVFIISILMICGTLIPWSIMVEEHSIEPDCTLPPGFGFRLWGTACGLTWVEFQDVRQTSYFAFATVVEKVRVMVLIATLVSILQFLYTVLRGTSKSPLLMASLLVSVLSIISLSTYMNEMQTTMAIPVHKIFIQGPGYMITMSAAAVSGSVFFTELFIHFYKLFYCARPSGVCECMEITAYVIVVCCLLTAFGELVKVVGCPDMLSPIDTWYDSNPLVPTVTVLGILVVSMGMALYVMIKFFVGYRKVINALLSSLGVVLVVIIGVAVSGADSVGMGFYFTIVGVVLDVFLGLVYNNIIDLTPLRKILSER